MNHLPKGLATLALLGGALLASALPAQSTADAADPIRFGMDSASLAAQAAAGVPADYGTFWIGPWTLSSGWGGPDGQLTTMRNANVTPAIHFYYWGDDISPSCVENGCWSSLHNAQKTRAGWEQLGAQLTDHLNAKMGGKPVVVFLESEFNKGGIETYEPFDGYMAAMAGKIHAAYPNAIIVLGFGNWGSHAWGTFDRTAAASDMVGIQGMRGSTRQAEVDMYTLYDGLLAGAKTLETKFPGKPIMLTDIAVSSYPEPNYLKVQSDVLAEVMANLAVLKSHGVQAIIYRSWQDSTGMDTANYYGMAERYWGLANSAQPKPAAQIWIDAVKAERTGSTPAPPAAPTPQPIEVGNGIAVQAEAFATRQGGGQQADGAAQGGAMWNQWSNGHVAQWFNATGAFDLTVRARGTGAAGVPAHMDVYVAGSRALSADAGAAYADHRVAINGTGPMEVRIAFTNDARTTTEDRNLIVDAVAFARPAPPNQAPTARITATVDGLTATLGGSGSSDPDGDALSFAWSFGDGTGSTQASTTHTYASAGSYLVVLSVSDGNLSANARHTVTATQPNRAPVAAFGAATAGLGVKVDAGASTDPDGDALTYAWAFGDGTVGSGRVANHTYAAGGTYAVQLSVSDGRLAASTTRTATVAGPYTANFTTNAASNAWWIQEKVSSVPAPAKVAVQVNGGSWQPMTLQSYGDWTLSAHVPKGSTVVFRATAPDGQVATSAPQTWLAKNASSTTTTTTGTPTFTATFAAKSVGNDWWVETAVSGSSAIAKVEARLNGGTWTQLPATSWGTYAKSLNAPNGTQVVFRATSSTGATATSGTVTWT